MKEKIEMIRTITRALAFLIPLVAGCIGMFFLEDVRETLVGFVMGSATAAAVFYYKRQEEPDDPEPTKDPDEKE